MPTIEEDKTVTVQDQGLWGSEDLASTEWIDRMFGLRTDGSGWSILVHDWCTIGRCPIPISLRCHGEYKMLLGSVKSAMRAYPTHGSDYGRRIIRLGSHRATCPERSFQYNHWDTWVMCERFSQFEKGKLDVTMLISSESPRALMARDQWHVPWILEVWDSIRSTFCANLL